MLQKVGYFKPNFKQLVFSTFLDILNLVYLAKISGLQHIMLNTLDCKHF